MTSVRKHAPRDVYETREGYRCGICHEPVVRYSAPRAVWKHKIGVDINLP